MSGADDGQNYNLNNEWVQIYSVSFDDSWILANLPPTEFVIASTVNPSKTYIYRNAEPLPPGKYFWLDGGEGCVVTTDFYELLVPPTCDVPAFPIPSSKLIRGEPEFVDAVPYDTALGSPLK